MVRLAVSNQARRSISVETTKNYKLHQFLLLPQNHAVANVIDSMVKRKQTSLSELAKMVGIDHSYVSRFRDGSRVPKRELALLIFREWPLTEDEKVIIASSWGYLLPGYRMVSTTRPITAKSTRADDV